MKSLEQPCLLVGLVAGQSLSPLALHRQRAQVQHWVVRGLRGVVTRASGAHCGVGVARLHTYVVARIAESRRQRAYKRGRLRSASVAGAVGAKCGERAGNSSLALEGQRMKMRSMVQCMGLQQATQTRGSAWRDGQEYRPVRTALPNPSIERTYNGGRPCAVLRALRAPLYAAHVER